MRSCSGPAYRLLLAALSCLCAVVVGTPVCAQGAPVAPPAILELEFTPTGYAQIAIWVEDAAGAFLATVALTDAVATRGIGNRPGASQMNSGFRWPYGRREGALPVWAHRRAAAEGATLFQRVIFQARRSEGLASRTSDDFSPDNYFCLSFDNSRSQKDALDAVSCASIFNSDKGRYLTPVDVAKSYAEPYEDTQSHAGRMQLLSLTSLYPPRRDLKSCAPGCYEHADVAHYADDARAVMPEIDAVTMATPKGGEPKRLIFLVPAQWLAGKYRACLEINVEGDYNPHYNNVLYPTPHSPAASWDSWALNYGYPYRGQPSLTYCAPVQLGLSGQVSSTADQPEGAITSWDTAASSYGQLASVTTMTDDPVKAPGSGADRLLLSGDGYRLKATIKPPLACKDNQPPSSVQDLALGPYPSPLHAHQWITLAFRAASDDVGVFRYEVRVSTDPITDEASFMRGQPAKSASVEAEELSVPAGTKSGETIHVDMGGLYAQTHYYVGVRAVDGCAQPSPISVAEISMPSRVFATVTPCFVATAAYGTPMAQEISALRRFRDRQLSSNVVGRAFVQLYCVVGPKLAAVIAKHEELRSITRGLLAPVVAWARVLSE
ncbi:MAG TPA: CFI-box-CTERM domain-containing protein [Polyangiales bacterium]